MQAATRGAWASVAWRGEEAGAALEQATAALAQGRSVVVDAAAGVGASASERGVWAELVRRARGSSGRRVDLVALVLEDAPGRALAIGAGWQGAHRQQQSQQKGGAWCEAAWSRDSSLGEGFAGVLRADSGHLAELSRMLGQLGVPPVWDRFWQALPPTGPGAPHVPQHPVQQPWQQAHQPQQAPPLPPRQRQHAEEDGQRRREPKGRQGKGRQGKGKDRGRAKREDRDGSPSYKRLQRMPAFGGLLVLFDLNGTLTCHTSVRRSTGITTLRPGAAKALLRLRAAGRLRLGIFSSATWRTVNEAVGMLTSAAREAGLPEGEQLFDVVLNRDQCQICPGLNGKAWDSNKPLAPLEPYTGVPLERTILVDDDEHKSVPAEREQLLRCPLWDGRGEDPVSEWLVDALLSRTLGEMLPGARAKAIKPSKLSGASDGVQQQDDVAMAGIASGDGDAAAQETHNAVAEAAYAAGDAARIAAEAGMLLAGRFEAWLLENPRPPPPVVEAEDMDAEQPGTVSTADTLKPIQAAAAQKEGS